MRYLTNGVLLALLLAFTACNVINPEEELPGYLNINMGTVMVDSLTGFENEMGLKDIWVWQGGIYLGTFPLPATIPFINRDLNDFAIRGGVFETGLSSFRIPYPFWETIEFTIDQPALDTFSITPTFTYRPFSQIDVAITEDFNGSIHKFSDTGDFPNISLLEKYTVDAFEGIASGRAEFDSTRIFLDVISTDFRVPRNIDIYAEITYKSDFPLNVGIYYDDLGVGSRVVSPVTFAPQTEWTTVYVHLVDEVRAAPDFEDMDLFLWMNVFGAGESGSFLVDNVRVVHFK